VIKIVLDPGHGGSDPGAVGPSGLKESYLTLEVAKKARWFLARWGYEVYMTRTDDVFVSLEDRVKFANEAEAFVFASIHFNAASPEAEGIETWYPNNVNNTVRSYEAGAALSYITHDSIMMLVSAVDRGCKFKDVEREEFYVIRNTLMPACLFELGFISNPASEALFKERYYLDRLALGVAMGLDRYCKI
jgi:N-acetylmuramoyl-L-alanine amidase